MPAPMIPRVGSSAARPAAVTASATPSPMLDSSGLPTACSSASSTRLRPKTTPATSSTLPTPAAPAKESPKSSRIRVGSKTKIGIETRVAQIRVALTISRAICCCSDRAFSRAIIGSATRAKEKPIRVVSEVSVTATT